jgi:hypothetical protein
MAGFDRNRWLVCVGISGWNGSELPAALLRIPHLKRFYRYESGIPSHDTLCDVFAALDPELFKACFLAWINGLRDGDPDIIAVDGKTARRSHDRRKGRNPLHLVSAWAARQRIVLGQQATEEKSNEITAIPLLLQHLDLKGALVTPRLRRGRLWMPWGRRPTSPARSVMGVAIIACR